jgi:hypothetical protein
MRRQRPDGDLCLQACEVELPGQAGGPSTIPSSGTPLEEALGLRVLAFSSALKWLIALCKVDGSTSALHSSQAVGQAVKLKRGAVAGRYLEPCDQAGPAVA